MDIISPSMCSPLNSSLLSSSNCLPLSFTILLTMMSWSSPQVPLSCKASKIQNTFLFQCFNPCIVTWSMVRSWGWRCGRVSFGQFFTSFLDNILVSKQTVASNIKYIILFYYSRTIASTRMQMGVKLFIGSMTWCLGEPLYCINTINSNRSMATYLFWFASKKRSSSSSINSFKLRFLHEL